ncbi:septum formation protein Maf [Rubellimicrobium rubrum]|uniref:dTTP/UTP pyrophosphatase n=1 Tax=Rubellimicrobium rubrum TaxID=2585369 RepID=A0A5C4N6R0_9RHOB|nr:Maf family protein [Rubellimicrobium rubrum]TNC51981.1 septum formation protein Maf [Rubellimicrobium rubrum]
MTTLAPDPAVRLVLGSASPRRLDLLAQAGITPHAVRPPEIDETPRKAETPLDYVRRIAREKIAAIQVAEDEVVLCADTTVALGRRILGKPADEASARAMLSLLAGRRHRVITAVTVRRGDRVWERAVTTAVAVKPLTDAEIEAYIGTDDWRGKAGSYAIQGPFGAHIPWINGSFTGVVGLPLTETLGLLTAAGLAGGPR